MEALTPPLNDLKHNTFDIASDKTNLSEIQKLKGQSRALNRKMQGTITGGGDLTPL